MPTNAFGQPIGPPLEGWTAPPVVGPTTLEGRACRIEPLHAHHVEQLYRALALDSPPSTWTYIAGGPFEDRVDFTSYLRSLAEPTDWEPHALLDASGAPRGIACYLRIAPGAGSVEVGGITYSAAMQRTTMATEAMFLMARHVFEDLGYRRYEWKCDDLNAPSRAAAARLGFVYEGTFRNAVVYKERSRDTAWFSITDDEWRILRPAYDAWLSVTNFDEQGHQVRSLSELITEARNG